MDEVPEKLTGCPNCAALRVQLHELERQIEKLDAGKRAYFSACSEMNLRLVPLQELAHALLVIGRAMREPVDVAPGAEPRS